MADKAEEAVTPSGAGSGEDDRQRFITTLKSVVAKVVAMGAVAEATAFSLRGIRLVIAQEMACVYDALMPEDRLSSGQASPGAFSPDAFSSGTFSAGTFLSGTSSPGAASPAASGPLAEFVDVTRPSLVALSARMAQGVDRLSGRLVRIAPVVNGLLSASPGTPFAAPGVATAPSANAVTARVVRACADLPWRAAIGAVRSRPGAWPIAEAAAGQRSAVRKHSALVARAKGQETHTAVIRASGALQARTETAARYFNQQVLRHGSTLSQVFSSFRPEVSNVARYGMQLMPQGARPVTASSVSMTAGAKIQQQTHITVYGTADPVATGREVAARQTGVNSLLTQTLTPKVR